MKTFARAKAVAANMMKSVAKVFTPVPFVMPDFDNMTLTEIKDLCREEGVRVGRKEKSRLLSELKEAYELYPSDTE